MCLSFYALAAVTTLGWVVIYLSRDFYFNFGQLEPHVRYRVVVYTVAILLCTLVLMGLLLD